MVQNLLFGFRISVLWIFISITIPGQIHASLSLCDSAAIYASRNSDVPLDILRAITRVETGRTENGVTHPWPWAINRSGEGFWFKDQDDALAFAFSQVKAGVVNFDVGCFQLNYRWHGNSFSSIEEMLEPKRNALYAARYLRRLHSELGDWESAVGAYHSRTLTYSQRYLARFQDVHNDLDGLEPDRSILTEASSRELIPNQNGGTRTSGSLVSLSSTRVGTKALFELERD